MPRGFSAEEQDGQTSTGSECVGCSGDVVRVRTTAYRGDPMLQIIGPGSKNQMTTSISYHCSQCGIMYAFPPPAGSRPASRPSSSTPFRG